MADFDLAVLHVMAQEGGFVDDPTDPGGATNMGISLRFLRALTNEKLRNYGFNATVDTISKVDVAQISPAQAKAIYKGEFWDHAPFASINNQDVCNYVFDMACNMGIAPAIKCAQRACWAVRQDKSILCDDGILGEHSLDYINAAEIGLLAPMRSERAGDYRLDAAVRPREGAVDLGGWLNRAYNKTRV